MELSSNSQKIRLSSIFTKLLKFGRSGEQSNIDIFLAIILYLFIAANNTTLTAQNQAVKIIQDENLVKNAQYFWSKDTLYLLDGLLYLKENSILKIEAGTLIKAKVKPSNGDVATALIIAKGAKIEAKGNRSNPIIFTSELDDTKQPFDLDKTNRGLWGGLMVLGKAPVFKENITTPSTSLNLPKANYGGNNMGDDSGILQYISIRHAGAKVKESNFAGLFLGGIGQKTVIDHIDVYASLGDGIKIHGGKVGLRYCSVAFCGDDSFEWAGGWQGKGQYWFAIQAPDMADHAIEAKGVLATKSKDLILPIIYNATLIGPGVTAKGQTSVALSFSKNATATIANSILVDFPQYAVRIENQLNATQDSWQQLKDKKLQFLFNTWSAFGTGSTFDDPENSILFPNLSSSDFSVLANHFIDNSNTLIANPIRQISRQSEASLDPSILKSEVIRQNPIGDTFFETEQDLCKERGAFNSLGAFWLQDWTALDNNLYLKHPCFDKMYEAIPFSDTITIPCNKLEDLKRNINFEKCPSDCDKSGGTALARRKRRKKRKRSLIPDAFCYLEEWVWKGYEYADKNSTQIIDSFEMVKIVQVIDTIPPEIAILPCADCEILPFKVVVSDCDTAWIISESQDTVLEKNKMIVNYFWEAVDFCGNYTSLSLVEHTDKRASYWYLDQDGDGFGDKNKKILWSSPLPNYVKNSTDCEDTNPNIYPTAQEDFSTLEDENCNNKLEYFDSCQFAYYIPITKEKVFKKISTLHGSPTNLALKESCFNGQEQDVWLQTIAPHARKIKLIIRKVAGSQLSSGNMEIYQGNCDNLKKVNCNNFNFLFDTHFTTEIVNLKPNTQLLLRIGKDVWSQEGALEIAITAME